MINQNVFAALKSKSTTELKRHALKSYQLQKSNAARENSASALYYKEMEDACIVILAHRIVFRKGGSFYTEWERPVNEYGHQTLTFSLVKDKDVNDYLHDMRIRRDAASILARLNSSVSLVRL